jgi:molecular chaperone GrpE
MEEEIRSAVEETVTDSTSVENAEADEPGAEWSKEKAELEDLLRRRQAEFENFRRRMERERMDFAEYSGMEVIKALLPSVDDFERALKAASVSGPSDEFIKGVELVYKRLLEALTKQGLEPINTEGQTFDPHFHEAVQRVEQDEAADGAILEEYQRGYKFKGKLLRPSMVKVAVRP